MIRVKEAQRMKGRGRREVRLQEGEEEQSSGAAAEQTTMRARGENWGENLDTELQSDEMHCSKDFCWCSLGGSRGGREENDFREKQGG